MPENKELQPPHITIKVGRICEECFEYVDSEPITLKYQHNYIKKNYCPNCGEEYYMDIDVIEQ